VNPVLIFLHIDQGCFDCRSYTPFASPVANSRSIHKANVDELCKELFKNKKKIVHQEDFAVTAYDVRLNSDVDATTEVMEYRCTLNRDIESDVKVVGKKAEATTQTTILQLYLRVSCSAMILSAQERSS
jgi:hypothetical protein